MEIISVTLLILAGQSICFGLGRLYLYWTYDVIIMEVFVTTFTVVFLALIVFSKMSIDGFFITLILSILFPYLFIKLNIGKSFNEINEKSIIGCVFWLFLVIIFITTSFKFNEINIYINQIYSLNEIMFVYNFGIFVVSAVFSIHMFVYECKQIMK